MIHIVHVPERDHSGAN